MQSQSSTSHFEEASRFIIMFIITWPGLLQYIYGASIVVLPGWTSTPSITDMLLILLLLLYLLLLLLILLLLVSVIDNVSAANYARVTTTSMTKTNSK